MFISNKEGGAWNLVLRWAPAQSATADEVAATSARVCDRLAPGIGREGLRSVIVSTVADAPTVPAGAGQRCVVGATVPGSELAEIEAIP